MTPREHQGSKTRGDEHAPCAMLSHVTLQYESGAQALNDVSLTVERGEHLCVLGANGSGKSTLASVVCGLLAPDNGVVELVGQTVFDARRTDPIDFAAYRRARRSIGLVFQNPDDQIVTTVVEEDVAFGPENLGVPPKEIGSRVERELHRVGMTAYAKENPTRLSGGQKQRVTIAGALAMRPEVIVFDEPGSLLDVRGRTAIMRVMRALHADGTTIVHITHFMEEALCANRVIVLDRGRIVAEGSPSQVFSQTSKILSLGLEEPFVAQLSRRTGIPWTCDEDDAAEKLTRRATQNGKNTFSTSGQATACACAIRANHVSYSYKRDRKALDDVSFEIPSGSWTAIVGHTGSGKSTLLRLLCALETPDEGEVVVQGICTKRRRDRRRLHGTIGYVMQHPERQLFAETVRQDVAFGPTNLGLSQEEVAHRCTRALQMVGLEGLDEASPFELSGGQQRLCAIAGVLAMEPQTIVLDEPTAGLDPRGRTELRRILSRIHERGVTIVEVTHSMDDAAHANKVIVLEESRVMLEGTPRELFCAANEDRLSKAGLGLPHALQWALKLGIEGNPLTLDELVLALGSHAPQEGEVMSYGA
ncbi:MAG: energy-coupling factor transporter ATPase [Coriobacteriales bacterium]|nr:energy-coupling factor transporter ATPase [Coriobacteriales bacterium]